MKLSEELKWRGFINQTTIDNLAYLDENKLSFYHGYDASGNSLTIGNLAAIMLDKVFIKHGWKPVILSGGATSLIGDPGGKENERQLQAIEQINQNVASVSKQIELLIGSQATFVNNLDWYQNMNILDFLRDVGKHFSMTPLVQRDYVAKRLGEAGKGITFAEFSYTLLQGYDFLYLFRKYGVVLQIAGSDQWGNSLSGIDLIRRVESKTVNVLTCPLIINKATGKKFGKSEEGAIWLDPNLTSVFKFYQFWLNIPDEDVEYYLKIYTELDKHQVESVMQQFNSNKSARIAQKTLAFEVTKIVHGITSAESVQKSSEILFGNQNYQKLNKLDLDLLKNDLPLVATDLTHSIIDTLVGSKLLGSKSEVRRKITQGAVYLNGQKLTSDRNWQKEDTIDGNHIIVRIGKNHNAIIQFNNF